MFAANIVRPFGEQITSFVRFAFHAAVRIRVNFAGYHRADALLPPCVPPHIPRNVEDFINFVLDHYATLTNRQFDTCKRMFIRKWSNARILAEEWPLIQTIQERLATVQQRPAIQHRPPVAPMPVRRVPAAPEDNNENRAPKKNLGCKPKENDRDSSDNDSDDDDKGMGGIASEKADPIEDYLSEEEVISPVRGKKGPEGASASKQKSSEKKKLAKGSDDAVLINSDEMSPQASLTTPRQPAKPSKAEQGSPTPSPNSQVKRKESARRQLLSPARPHYLLDLTEDLELSLPAPQWLDDAEDDDLV